MGAKCKKIPGEQKWKMGPAEQKWEKVSVEQKLFGYKRGCLGDFCYFDV